ncbi:MAG: 3-phosphoshikimate 1-carboxyvinyltransferase, partial [Weeksellaceae bacterium]|nr:3-phosphoshikimate 1-carboxyvinyltransferase [Weeksellaceae bacterium]
PKSFEINLNDTPDLAQTIAVTAAGLQLKCQLNGLQTLKIKETDRLYALQNELQKIGVSAEITSNSISLTNFSETDKIPLIKTYNDHRMAMSFAPLCLLRELKIENPEVVNKSYPGFWQDFENCFLDGFDF